MKSIKAIVMAILLGIGGVAVAASSNAATETAAKDCCKTECPAKPCCPTECPPCK